jgi:outer membrane protein OmpA-like peptidoglycan-associated protein
MNALMNILMIVMVSAICLCGVSFAQTDIPRQTVAITYPQDQVVLVQFRGTTRFPRMSGEARIKRTKKNGTEIELKVSKMPRPFELGAGYATYVLWAISPDGQIDNLGEIRRRGTFEFDSTISVTTPLQQFSLIITAEPHFLVRRPSRAVMLENYSGHTREGRFVATTKTVQYFGNSSDYFRDARTPEIAETDYARTPPTVLQAKQAVALAQYAGADRDAPEELQTATTLMNNAENAWKAGRDSAQVDLTARQAISAAVKAEDTAVIRKEAREKRNERSRQDAEVRNVEKKYLDAQDEISSLKAELAQEIRNRELAERDAENLRDQLKEVRDENSRLREELGKVRADSEDARVRLARIEGESKAMREQREREMKNARIQQNSALLMETLKSFGAVKQSERGIVLSLGETYWTAVRGSSLGASAETKVKNLANIISNNSDFRVSIEAHTDNRGTPEELLSLTQDRANTISTRFSLNGVEQSRIEARGFGAQLPVMPNTTNANRAKNRRIEIILTPILE